MDDGERAERLEREQRNISLNAIQVEKQRKITLKFDKQNNRICIDCDAVIDENRIAAQPAAERCFSCQEVHESHRGQYA